MGFDTFFHYLNLILQVFVVNLLLSGDNAVVIALACRSLPPELTRRAMLIGIEGAIAMRILLTAVAGVLMRIPLLKLAGGVALVVIALKLTVERQDEARPAQRSPGIATGLWSAVGTIFVADLVMSVDNVVALAAVAQGSIVILSIGLLMSVPLLLYGSLFVNALLKRYPLLKRGGGALLGWLAGDIAISDPMIADWVNQQSPALTVVIPILVVLFVLIESRIMEGTQTAANALRPSPRPRPTAATAAEAAPVVTIDSPPVAAVESTPERKRRSPWVWIVAAIVVALLWIFFRSLSLDYASSTPAIQWTPPTGTR
ncbi:MAG: TerC family protein [Steroidobacterales bacterium]